MAAKPETTFTAGINKLLPKHVYHMKNNNMYVGGIPDVWYSGSRDDLWVEYKYLPRTPSRAAVKPMTLLSGLQQAWLRDRYDQGRSVAVIVGCPDGGIVLTDKSWEMVFTVKEFLDRLKSKAELAAWIVERVN